jgi:hypothetical protein
MSTSRWSTGDGTPPIELSEGVLPAVIRTRSDGTERFICYDDSDGTSADTAWLSVDADSTVSLLLWR